MTWAFTKWMIQICVFWLKWQRLRVVGQVSVHHLHFFHIECGSWEGPCSPAPHCKLGQWPGEQGHDWPQLMKGKLPRVSGHFHPEVHQSGPTVLGNTWATWDRVRGGGAGKELRKSEDRLGKERCVCRGRWERSPWWPPRHHCQSRQPLAKHPSAGGL